MIDKDTILIEIIPYLSQGKSGKEQEIDICGIVQLIFYRLKTGCQWRELPVKQFIDRVDTKWGSIYYHYNKWCKDGSWKAVWQNLLKEYKCYLDLSCINIDGSHTKAFRGGEEVGYQGRKGYNSTNMLFIVDNQGVILFCSKPISGQHNDLYNIEEYFNEMAEMAKSTDIELDGLFLNGDGGFDSEGFRELLDGKNIVANIPENKRRKSNLDSDNHFDEVLYKRRSFCEHPFAWMDAYKGLLVRYEKLSITWLSMNLMGMIQIFYRKIKKHIKKKTQF